MGNGRCQYYMGTQPERIPYARPSITDKEIKWVNLAVRDGWGDERNVWVEWLEKAFAEYIGVKHAIATSSCTGAMHLGLAGLGIGWGDTVVLADANWVATVAPIVYLGAKPLFVDILRDSWCIDPNFKIPWPMPKAIIATHLYGNLCDMNSLTTLGDLLDIPIIEDAAEAIGSEYFGQKAGSMGKFGVFSFHGTKTITTGEGGMFVTNDSDLYEKVLRLSNHGRGEFSPMFWPEVVGYKYKMSNIQAALGCAQLSRIDELIKSKREIMKQYRSLLAGTGLEMNPEPKGCYNSYWMPTIVAQPPVTRGGLMKSFAAENIDTRIFFHPLSSLPMFKDRPKNVNAWDIPQRAINLPSFYGMEHEQIARVIKAVKNAIY